MATYNGHKDYNHWNVSLWIGNDEGLYKQAKCALRLGKTKEAAARLLLAELPEKTPDGVPYTLSAVRAALVGL